MRSLLDEALHAALEDEHSAVLVGLSHWARPTESELAVALELAKRLRGNNVVEEGLGEVDMQSPDITIYNSSGDSKEMEEEEKEEDVLGYKVQKEIEYFNYKPKIHAFFNEREQKKTASILVQEEYSKYVQMMLDKGTVKEKNVDKFIIHEDICVFSLSNGSAIVTDTRMKNFSFIPSDAIKSKITELCLSPDKDLLVLGYEVGFNFSNLHI
jgi:hypothetical protein